MWCLSTARRSAEPRAPASVTKFSAYCGAALGSDTIYWQIKSKAELQGLLTGARDGEERHFVMQPPLSFPVGARKKDFLTAQVTPNAYMHRPPLLTQHRKGGKHRLH